jgi:hypothetical protein
LCDLRGTCGIRSYCVKFVEIFLTLLELLMLLKLSRGATNRFCNYHVSRVYKHVPANICYVRTALFCASLTYLLVGSRFNFP